MSGTIVRLGRFPAALAALCVVAGALCLQADGAPTGRALGARVRVIDFEGEIEPSLSAYLRRSVANAQSDGVTDIVLAIDSPGGRVDSMLEIVEVLLALPKSIRTTAWIEHQAISAAAFTALACDEIVMAPGATIGDCQPIIQNGDTGFVPAGEKVETYLRAQFRRIAAAKGWDPILLEKLVSKDRAVIEVKVTGRGGDVGKTLYVYDDEFQSAREFDRVAGHAKNNLERLSVVVPDGRLLTLTTLEAQKLGFVKRIFADTKAFEASWTTDGGTIEHVSMTATERAGRWLLGLAGVLAGIVMLCLILSLFQGIGTPAIVGLAALALLGLVTATADLANGFAWFLVGTGALLLLTEAFLLPGTAIPGILGVVAMGAGFLFLTTGTSFDRRGNLSWDAARAFLLQTVLAIGATAAIFVVLTRWFPRLPFGGRSIVAGAQGLPAFGADAPLRAAVLAGQRGTASTDLRPAGHAQFDSAPGASIDVVSEGAFIESGTVLEVVRVEGHRVVVRSASPERPA